MKMMMGSTCTAKMKPVVTVKPWPSGVVPEKLPVSVQLPNTRLMPLLAKPMKASAVSFAAMKKRAPTAVRRVTTAIRIGKPSPHAMMRGLSARRRSIESAQASPRITTIPKRPIIRASGFMHQGRGESQIQGASGHGHRRGARGSLPRRLGPPEKEQSHGEAVDPDHPDWRYGCRLREQQQQRDWWLWR